MKIYYSQWPISWQQFVLTLLRMRHGVMDGTTDDVPPFVPTGEETGTCTILPLLCTIILQYANPVGI